MMADHLPSATWYAHKLILIWMGKKFEGNFKAISLAAGKFSKSF